MLRNSDETYGSVLRILHWLIALLIIGLIALGWYMVDLTYYDRWYNESLSLHKALGILVIELALIQLFWSIYSPAPKLASTLKTWERIAAKTTHVVLILMMFLIPLTGYVISTSAGDGVSFFGLYEVPALLSKNKELSELAEDVHYYLAYGTAVLVAMHALAALKHQFVDKDGTLSRMIGGSRKAAA